MNKLLIPYHDDPIITLMYGLRNGKAWFSAAELIKQLSEANCIDEWVNIKNEYLKNKTLYDSAGKRPSVEAIQAKNKQIDSAFEKLIKSKDSLEKLKRINVITIYENTDKTKFFKLPSNQNFVDTVPRNQESLNIIANTL